MPRQAFVLFSALFFLSGMAGLVYEVCWTRLLRLPLGNTLHSMTAVLTAFMAGLAFGAWIAGRWIDRRGHPLRVYAILEAAIGLACFLLPWAIAAQEPLFRAVYRSAESSPIAFDALRFFSCALVLFVPATLMGATLPVLCRAFVDRNARLGSTIGWLYAVNALGAAAGSLLAGFVLVPQLGLRGAIWAGVATSLTVALLAWWGQHGVPAPTHSGAREAEGRRQASALANPLRPPMRAVLLLGYGLSGLAAMVLQIAWARALALLLGSSVYAFSLLVSAFILGLALGSAAAGRVADRLRDPGVGFAIAQIGIGVTALAMVPVFQRYPEWMLSIVPNVAHDFGRFQLVQFALVFATLLLPTACMGACLPFVGRAVAQGVANVGETVGRAYSANAAGTIAGAFAGGFFFLPMLGMHRAILAAAAINLLVGAAVLVVFLPRRRALLAASAVLVIGAAALAIVPPFDAATVTSGMYLYADRMQRDLQPGTDLRTQMKDEYQILLHEEGPNATVTVRETTSGQRILALNGKSDASDGGDMPTQALLGHLPCLMHPGPRDVAVVGLASGVTVHAVGTHPTVQSIDCIEIAPEVAQACRLFDHVNGGVLDDPRLRLVFQDARNHMALGSHPYDVIVSEPSNPWIAGIASLFTREYVQACRDRLRPGGVLCQWVQLYGLDDHALQSVIRTFLEVFPDATLWESVFAADFILVGRAVDRAVDREAIDLWAERMATPTVATSLARVGIRTPADLLVRHVADAPRLHAFAASGEVYRDDRNRLEFEAPRLMHRVTEMSTLESLQALREPGGWPSWMAPSSDPEVATELQAAQAAQRVFFQGVVLASRGDAIAATDRFVATLDQHPGASSVWPHLLETSRPWVASALARGDTVAAIGFYEHVLAYEPDVVEFYTDAALLRANRGDLPGAMEAYRRALELRPRNVLARVNWATGLVRQGEPKMAEIELRRVLEQRPDHLRARLALGNLRMQADDAEAAEGEYRRATTAHPDAAQAWFLLGESLRRQGQRDAARDAYDVALRRDPDHRPAMQARRAIGGESQ